MLFNSFIFFIFLAFVFGIYLLLPTRRARVIFLLAASYLFYGYWDWRFTLLLAISTMTDFAVGRGLGKTEEKNKRKRLLLLSCLTNLSILGFFKYFNFFLDTAQVLAGSLGLNTATLHLNIVLPIGISFYTFKTLSYTIDVYRRKLEPTRALADYALFVAFFPNLVAGPIERAGKLLPQIAGLKAPTRTHVREGLVLISLGLFKKVLIGDAAGRIVDNIFGQPELYLSPELLAGLLLFSIQVYADFAGYSNIAGGVARLFGVELMKNFEQPYLSRSFSEFWRRWHISLSTWIWDYLFNPLMSAFLRRISRLKLPDVKQEMRIAYPAAALITMLLCGLWHGAGVTFIVWGGLQGLFLSIERLFVYGNKAIPMRKRIRSVRELLRSLAGWTSTQLLVVFAWLFFRAEDLGQVGYFLKHIVHWQGSDLTGRFAMIVLAFGAMVLLLDLIEYFSRSDVYLLRMPRMATAAICAAILVVVALYMATNKPMPFVYFQF
jgi:D-alanyl-lipoteichoic acid acyltransferase DltB (MBOAT superfamily)